MDQIGTFKINHVSLPNLFSSVCHANTARSLELQFARWWGLRAIQANMFHFLGFCNLPGVDPRAAWLLGMWETLCGPCWILFWNKVLEDYFGSFTGSTFWIPVPFKDWKRSSSITGQATNGSSPLLQTAACWTVMFWLYKFGRTCSHAKKYCWGDIKVVAQILPWWRFECFSKLVDCLARFLTCP